MIVGIDLGTTNSLVAVWQNGDAVVIPNSLGHKLTPSVVSQDDDGTILVGAPAKDRLMTHPEWTASVFKRYMGTNRTIPIGERNYRPEELSALVIKSLISDAAHFLGDTVDEAVISVPAYFNDTQRRATKIAGELAGIKVERLINEPTAAALAYGLHHRETDSKYLVLDLGGGTYDVTLLELFDGVIEIHASAGDNFLGGEDFSNMLVEAFVSHHDIPKKAVTGKLLQNLRHEAERVKIKLQAQSQATMHVEWLSQTKHLELSTTQFNELVAPLVKRLVAPIERTLRDGRLDPGRIDDILLVGGSSRLQCVRRLVAQLFRRLPAPNINADETIALGAAIQAGLKSRDGALRDIVMTDVTPYTLGTDSSERFGTSIVANDVYTPIIERNSTVPISRSKIFSTLHDHQKRLRVAIYQGESPDVKDNVYLGELDIPVPPKPAGEVSIETRFTYDINGLLEVEVTVLDTGEKHKIVIEKTPGAMSREEIDSCMKALEHLKVHPREHLQNKALMTRAARLFETALKEEREQIGHLIVQFKAILETQDEERIAPAREKFSDIIATLEARHSIFL